jgi:hypothetical protein
MISLVLRHPYPKTDVRKILGSIENTDPVFLYFVIIFPGACPIKFNGVNFSVLFSKLGHVITENFLLSNVNRASLGKQITKLL